MKKVLFGALLAVLVLLTPSALRAQNGHEYAPLQEKEINYKNWTLPALADGAPLALHDLIKDKKLVMVVYFAPWCHNWENDAPVVARLYEKYKAQGFEVIAVSEYGGKDLIRQFFGEKGAPYPVVIESDASEQRDQTSHYAYRQLTGDTRRWGSPWHLFIEPAKVKADGDVLVKKAYTNNGELIEEEADKFIAERLAKADKQMRDK